MVQELRKLLMGRVELRLLVLLAAGVLIGTLAWASLQLAKAQTEDLQTLNTWQELVEEYLDFREDSARMVIPAWLPEESVDWASLQSDPFWYWDFEAGVFYFDDGSELSKQIPHDTRLVVYEDMASDEILILSVPESGKESCREELVIRAPEWPEALATRRALDRELCKRRVVWHITLKSHQLAEREAALDPLADGGGTMQMMALESLTELAITQIKVVSNRLQVGVSYPASYSGAVWSVYSYDAPACPAVEGTAPGPNGMPLPDETNEVTGTTWEGCPLEHSRRFQGLENVWTLAHSNLVLSGETTTLWLDSRPLAVDTNGEPCHRFYGAGANNMDEDLDGLADAFELFVFHSNPAQWDSDGDGQSDGAEYLAGSNPGNPNDPPNIAGTVFYSGMQTGLIRVVAATNADDWAGAYQTTLQSPGAFHLFNLPAAQYWIKAYRDLDGDNQQNGLEAACAYSNNPIVLTGRMEGVQLELEELDSDNDGFTDYEEIVVFRSDPHAAGDLPAQYSTASDDVYFGHPQINSTNFVYSTGFLFENVYMGKGWIINGVFTPDLRSPSATVYYGMPDYLDCTNFFVHSHSPCMHDVNMGKGWATHQGFITDFRQASELVYYGQPDSLSHRSLFVHSLEFTANYVGMGKGWVTNNGFVADYNEPSFMVYFSRPDWVAHPSLYVYSSSPPGANLQYVAYGWPRPGGFVPDLARSSGAVYFGSPTLNGPVKNFYYAQSSPPHHSVFVGYGWPTMDGMLASLSLGYSGNIYYGRIPGYSNLYVYGRNAGELASPSREGTGWINLKDYAKYDDPSLDWDGDLKMDYYDPFDSSGYQEPNDSQTVEMKMEVGDTSDSHTEMYSLKVGPFVLRMPYVNSNEYLFSQAVQVTRSNAYIGCYLEALGDSDPDGDYCASVTGTGLLVVASNDVPGCYGDTGFNSGKRYFDVFVPRVDLLAHKPGTMTAPGMAISRVHEDRPDNLFLCVNDDNDDSGTTGHRDFDDTLIHPNDNDIVKIVLKKFLPGSLQRGTLELAVTPSNAVRVYKNSSALLNNYTLNLANRSGDLMSLPLMDIPLYIEAIAPCEEIVISLAYKSTGGQEICRDEVRMRALKAEIVRPIIDAQYPANNNYAFDALSPGVCRVTCLAKVTPDTPNIRRYLQGKLTWAIDDVPGATLTWEHGGSTGVGVYDAASASWRETAIFTGLPIQNSSFGNKEAYLHLDNFMVAGNAQIFYTKDAKNHPGDGSGETPNWYYYWSQTTANSESHVYGGNRPGFAGMVPYTGPNAGTIYVYDGASTIGAGYFPEFQSRTYIDCFASVVRHEGRHKADFYANWNPYSALHDQDANGGPDMLKDAVEAGLLGMNGLPYDNTRNDTNADGVMDGEDYASTAEQLWIVGTADHEDWAFPGNNSTK